MQHKKCIIFFWLFVGICFLPLAGMKKKTDKNRRTDSPSSDISPMGGNGRNLVSMETSRLEPKGMKTNQLESSEADSPSNEIFPVNRNAISEDIGLQIRNNNERMTSPTPEYLLYNECASPNPADFIIQNIPPNLLVNKKYGAQKNTPLIAASANGHAEVVKKLLEHKNIDVNCLNGLKQTALYVACKNGRLAVVRLLLACPKIALTTPQEVHTPLYIACSMKHVEIVKELVVAHLQRSLPDEKNFRLIKIMVSQNKSSGSAIKEVRLAIQRLGGAYKGERN